ncbi:MAG: hypothetical protein DRQ55_10645 [Planctomycetota bacterium]|nr:MAG: hypothetical protein DRQ55_10645 [Planctomycetota bacterium]
MIVMLLLAVSVAVAVAIAVAVAATVAVAACVAVRVRAAATAALVQLVPTGHVQVGEGRLPHLVCQGAQTLVVVIDLEAQQRRRVQLGLLVGGHVEPVDGDHVVRGQQRQVLLAADEVRVHEEIEAVGGRRAATVRVGKLTRQQIAAVEHDARGETHALAVEQHGTDGRAVDLRPVLTARVQGPIDHVVAQGLHGLFGRGDVTGLGHGVLPRRGGR